MFQSVTMYSLVHTQITILISQSCVGLFDLGGAVSAPLSAALADTVPDLCQDVCHSEVWLPSLRKQNISKTGS